MKAIVLLSVVLFCIVSQIVISAPEGSFIHKQKHNLWMSVFNAADYVMAPEYFVATVKPQRQARPVLLNKGYMPERQNRPQLVASLKAYLNKHHFRASQECEDALFRADFEKHPPTEGVQWREVNCINSTLFDWWLATDELLRYCGFERLPWPEPKVYIGFPEELVLMIGTVVKKRVLSRD